MSHIPVNINGRIFNINCPDNEHDKIRALEKCVNEKIIQIQPNCRSMNDLALLSFTLLAMADDVMTLKNTPPAPQNMVVGNDNDLLLQIQTLTQTLEIKSLQNNELEQNYQQLSQDYNDLKHQNIPSKDINMNVDSVAIDSEKSALIQEVYDLKQELIALKNAPPMVIETAQNIPPIVNISDKNAHSSDTFPDDITQHIQTALSQIKNLNTQIETNIAQLS